MIHSFSPLKDLDVFPLLLHSVLSAINTVNVVVILTGLNGSGCCCGSGICRAGC